MVLDDNGIDIVIDEFTNCLIVKESGREVKTEVKKREILKPNQYKGMIFDWVKEFQEGKDVYSLHLSGRTKVEGLIAIIPPNIKDEAINVTLVESALHNRGENPKHIGVGAHLFAIATLLSFQNGFEGYVMFDAKTNLIDHYTKTLGASQVGNSQRMIIDPKSSNILVQQYFPNLRKEW